MAFLRSFQIVNKINGHVSNVLKDKETLQKYVLNFFPILLRTVVH